MKKRASLIILIAVCVSLFAVYFIISSLPNDKSNEENDNAYLYVDQNDISKITEFSFVGGEYSLSFKKIGEAWKYTQNTTLPIKGDFVEDMLESTELILATRHIGKTDALYEYGLDDPSYTLTLRTHGGEIKYLFGDTIESKGVCYMTKEGSGQVYLVETSYIQSFSFDVSDCLSLDSYPLSENDEIVSIFTRCGEFESNISSSENENLTSSLASIILERYVDFGKEKFEIYGLSSDTAINIDVTLSNRETHSLVFGLGETEEFIYILVQNESGELSEMVYLVSCSEFEALYSHLSMALSSGP